MDGQASFNKGIQAFRDAAGDWFAFWGRVSDQQPDTPDGDDFFRMGYENERENYHSLWLNDRD